MKHSLPIKALTLLFFAFSVTSFVLYRGGFFDNDSHNSFQGSHNGGNFTTAKRDSINRALQKDTIDIIMMSGSKSGHIFYKFDSLKLPKQKYFPEKQPEKDEEPMIMPSSKVMIMREKKAKISDPPVTADTLKAFKQEKPKKRP